MVTILITTTLAVVVIGSVWLWYHESSRLKMQKFAGRNELPDSDFYERFIKIKGAGFPIHEVIEIRGKIASEIGVPKLLLMPDDTMGILGPAKGWEYDDELYCYINMLFEQCKKREIKTEQCNCLADIIELSLLVAKPAPSQAPTPDPKHP